MDRIEKCAKLFDILCEKYEGAELGRKVSQKMFYFFEREGIELNLRYGIHYYGPYSSKLDDAMGILENEKYIFIDIAGSTHVVRPGEEKVSEELTKAEQEIAEKVLNAFGKKSPFELEALSTMDFVANSILRREGTEEEIKSRFKVIKGNKFSEKIIRTSYDELVRLNLIAG